ncbi:16S rRNA (guanine(527)-N(7))-methyltransferase RsmG [Sporolactobacillus sp. THM7-4]|nr:16S rRNA (guanine(527)-N(7))-methyltransferase RsmG [Sporolactobacillus sp. THM7-4]
MKLLESLLLDKGIHLSPLQMEQFDTYYRQLVEWNQKMNLTTITDEEDVALKHFYDSVTPAFYFSFKGPLKLCDVGSGAGFPGVPLKIIFPDLQLTIVDALKKRLVFLNSLIESLELRNVSLFHERAEVFACKQEMREHFDLVTARAVANLSVLSEYCLPLVREHGTFIALKGLHAEKEIEQAAHAIRMLGGSLSRTETFILPEEDSRRTLFFIEKTAQTPKKYPRKPGVPAKDPL